MKICDKTYCKNIDKPYRKNIDKTYRKNIDKTYRKLIKLHHNNIVHFLFYIILINDIKLNKIEIINHYFMYIKNYL